MTPQDSVSPKHDLVDDYKDLFTGIGCLAGEHSIKIDTSVTPTVHAPRKVPLAIKDKLKDELDKMEKMGVIIKQNQPTEWVNSMVTPTKSNGKIRVCIDPRDLNQAIQREHYPMKTIEDITPKMRNAKIFSKVDATSGYWAIKLDERSSRLCTFNSPFGRYSFKRMPFGIKSAAEVYQREMTEIFQDIEGCEVIVDDIIIWGEDEDQHDRRLKRVLDRVREKNLKLNPDKCEFRKSSITYCGHVLSEKGLQADPEKVRAVKEMPRPTDKTELQSVLQFVQYLAKFVPNLSEVTAPLRQL